MKRAELKASLKNSGLSLTDARFELLSLLKKSPAPLSITEIFKKLKGRAPDQATLYRNVIQLQKAKLIASVELGDRLTRFEYSDNKSHHHHHVSCKKCGKVECIAVCVPKSLIDQVKSFGFSDIEHQLSFQAVCRDCSTIANRAQHAQTF